MYTVYASGVGESRLSRRSLKMEYGKGCGRNRNLREEGDGVDQLIKGLLVLLPKRVTVRTGL